MGRNFVKSNDKIDLGDVTAARMAAGTAFTALAFFRAETTTTNMAIMSKYSGGASGRQFQARVLSGNTVRLSYADGGTNITASGTINDNQWYLVAITNSSGNTTNIYVYTMDGTQNGTGSGTHPADVSDLTTPFTFGAQDNNGADFDGDIAFGSYFSIEMTVSQITSYLRDPYAVASLHQDNCVFSLPMLGVSPEPDFSGNGNSGTVVGGTVIGENPPTAPFMLFNYYEVIASPPAGGQFMTTNRGYW